MATKQPNYPPNEKQQQAIDYIDGPLIVLAGPGTGKTDLLSRRTKNILDNRDVAPQDILCITFTDIGAQAMRERLIANIGTQAYGIAIETFHSFALSLKKDYPQFFCRPSNNTLISDLQTSKIIGNILANLKREDPLYERPRTQKTEFEPSGIKNFLTFMRMYRYAGITKEQFIAIVNQTENCMNYLLDAIDNNQLTFPVLQGVRGHENKQMRIANFIDNLHELLDNSPKELDLFNENITSTPGVYIPYAKLLEQEFNDIDEMFDDNNKTTPFGAKRKKYFGSTKNPDLNINICKKAISAINVYELYRMELEKYNLYDFDDMILDAVEALEKSSEFKNLVSERFQYIQIDEFQDTNGAQMHLVELLLTDKTNPNIMVVGDDDQAIMRFQGASVEYIKQFRDRYNAHEINLEENFRSIPGIVDVSQAVVKHISNRHDASKVLYPHKKEQPFILQQNNYDNQDLEYYHLARDIKNKISELTVNNAINNKSIAVISKTHKSLIALIPYLNFFNISFSYKVNFTLEEMDVMQTLLALMRTIYYMSIGQHNYVDQFIPQIISAPEFGVDPIVCLEFSKRAHQESCTLRNKDDKNSSAWLNTLKTSEDPALKKIYDLLQDLSAHATSQSAIETIYEAAQPILNHYHSNKKANPYAVVQIQSGIKALVEFAKAESSVYRALNTQNKNKPISFSEIIERMNETAIYNNDIRVTINITSNDAITLTTAHGSKGDEYEYVYLIDADEQSWSESKSNASYIPNNMLFGNSPDEDDKHRLAFVAITRAKQSISVYLGRGNIISELNEVPYLTVNSYSIDPGSKPAIDDVATATELSWYTKLNLSEDDFVGTLKPNIENLVMSATVLNNFVTYKEGCSNSIDFVDSHILYLPGSPNISSTFGTIVHSFLENYVTHKYYLDDKEKTDELVAIYKKRIIEMDYDETAIKEKTDAFSRIVGYFLPQLKNTLINNQESRIYTEKSIKTQVEDIPVSGFCDLIIQNEDTKTIEVFDYKTGKNKSEEKPDEAYLRQLVFYRLLIENSSEFNGYKVSKISNLYVEPILKYNNKGKGYFNIGNEASYDITDNDVKYVKELLCAVWWRIKCGYFDTTQFESWGSLTTARDQCVKQNGEPKKLSKKSIQKLYEQWLIETWHNAL